jgi:hypothetical protein
MGISGISSTNSLFATPPANADGAEISQTIGVAVMKQQQETDAKQAQALVKMIEDSTPRPTAAGTGKIVNIGA